MAHQILLDSPGGKWDEGLFLGNGRLGASVLGQIFEETIPLNEETIWYGGPQNRINPDGRANLEEVRALLKAGEVSRAEFLTRAALYSGPKYLTPYLPAGDLRLSFYGLSKDTAHYRRVLDIDRALAEVSFTAGGVWHRREYFVSIARNVFAMRITGGAPFSLLASLNRRPYEEKTGKADGKTLFLRGQCGEGGVQYFGALRFVSQNGSARALGDNAAMENTDSAVLYVSFATDFLGNDRFEEEVLQNLDAAEKMGFDALRGEHLALWESLYGKTSLTLGEPLPQDVPTARLLQECRETGKGAAALCELLYCFGKYLLLSSSYRCKLPSTLQGIWNGSYTPSWESKYTININTEMNYWPAEGMDLSECCLPLFDLVERIAERGRETARDLYGCPGFVAHHNTNLWADTAPEGIFAASPMWPMGGAWLSLHFWEHYRYTLDRDFLKARALPVMEESVRFFLSYLTPDEDGTLLTGPSLSPENSYRSITGQAGALCMAPTMDSQILRELFTGYLAGCAVLGREPLPGTADALSHLPPTRTGPDGRILEWHEEYEEVEPGHRHVSHLFGLFPGSQITERDPALMEGARKTLAYRLSHGGGHTGWSCAWIICLFARLGDGENALQYLKRLLDRSMQDNLLDSHPPFQIDGNFGAAAAVMEMLFQSHTGEIELLPALPEEWRSGSLSGARLRGNLALDMNWEDGVLQKARFTAGQDCRVRVKYRGKTAEISLQKGVPFSLTPEFFA